jgi:hypothetical protein
MSDVKWRLKSDEGQDDTTSNPLYWSNEYGWTVKEDSTIFSEQEREDFAHCELLMDAAWVREL